MNGQSLYVRHMGRELISGNGNDKHTALVEEIFSPDSWKRPVVDQVLQIGRRLGFSGEV